MRPSLRGDGGPRAAGGAAPLGNALLNTCERALDDDDSGVFLELRDFLFGALGVTGERCRD